MITATRTAETAITTTETATATTATVTSEKFGIEIEFNNINRAKAAEIINTTLNGTLTENDILNIYVIEDQQGRKWTITRDSSIEGPADEECELATPPIYTADLPILKEIIMSLKAAGAKSSNARHCGIHLHIDSSKHTPKTIRNLVNIMAAHEDQLFKAFEVDEQRIRNYCKRAEKLFIEKINQNKVETVRELEDAWYRYTGPCTHREDHYHMSRYHALNLHALFTRYHTIEFRFAQWTEETSMDWTVLESFIRICLAMSELARKAKSASFKRQSDWTSAYSFRCWLLRLGFIGEDTKDVRKFLLKNFEGTKAWRRGTERGTRNGTENGAAA